MLKITLKAARVNAGLSQDDVIKKIHKSKPVLVAWENGKSDIGVQELHKLCKIYKIDPANILLPFELS